MAKLTIMFGLVLILLGLVGFVSSPLHAPTALIPCAVGVILALLGGLASTEDPKRRMLHMHIAVTVGLLGFLGTAEGLYQYIRMLLHYQYEHPIAIQEKAAMSVLLLVFVILCVRSFINARRARA